jgi:chromosomal replication initiation ATPase DnaA
MAMYLCQREGDMQLADIASRFGLKHYASAGASIRQFHKQLDADRNLCRLMNAIKLDLTP